ncbi:MAG TPA: DUF4352 domain-containing protein [Streptosporangiaceae bacterium]|jgi:hypothetical protein
MRKIMAMVTVVALLGGVSACSDDKNSADKKEPATYSLAPRAVRDFETPLPEKPVKLGEILYSVIAIRTGIVAVVGSHADWLPKGQYVRLRIAVTNEGRDMHNFTPLKQLLVANDGKTYKVSFDAMQIDRQPNGVLTVAREERREFDLWFDIPKTAKPQALRVVGDPSSTELGDQLKGTPSPGTKTTVDIAVS